MDKLLNKVASTVRGWMLWPARFLNAISFDRLKPSHITLISLLGHVWIFVELNNNHPVRAGLLLIFFGLMDSLDGALARLQKSSSHIGMLYDSASDRVKEVLVYAGITMFLFISDTFRSPDDRMFNFYLNHSINYGSIELWLPLVVCGLSIIVSYIRARGETVLVAAGMHSPKEINKVFSGGIARFEVRMALIVLGLLTGSTFIVLHILLMLLVITALQRLLQVRQALKNV